MEPSMTQASGLALAGVLFGSVSSTHFDTSRVKLLPWGMSASSSTKMKTVWPAASGKQRISSAELAGLRLVAARQSVTSSGGDLPVGMDTATYTPKSFPVLL